MGLLYLSSSELRHEWRTAHTIQSFRTESRCGADNRHTFVECVECLKNNDNCRSCATKSINWISGYAPT